MTACLSLANRTALGPEEPAAPGRAGGLRALRFTVLLDFSRPLVCRLDEGEANAAVSVLDDTQSGGMENSPDNGQADEEEEDATGPVAQHAKDYLDFSGSGTPMTMRGMRPSTFGTRGPAL